MRFAKGKEKRLSGQPLPLLPLETSDTIPNPRQSSPIAMGRLLPAPAGCMTSTCDAAAAPGLGGKDVLFLAAGIFLLWVLRRRFWMAGHAGNNNGDNVRRQYLERLRRYAHNPGY
ncbi:uncharacterized protein [Lolium perenne]|uniref:uncharacterized protein isoform X2 n=1 Tax=Lolium perenne TaxID=4522 RepID=UPI0021F6821B|nr:uncharacterized protein LOC127327409 isoform X2 [Lolium perenne]